MIRSLLIGLVAGSRSMTPLAAVSLAARRRRLPRGNGAPHILDTGLAGAGAVALAVGELLGDKMKSAPDRIVPAGMAARLVTGGLAGAALAPRDRRGLGVALGAAGAVLSAYLTYDLRMRALRRWGQTATGLVEDALVVGATSWIMAGAARDDARAV